MGRVARVSADMPEELAAVGLEVERRIAQLEDIRDILDTLHRYVLTIDAGDAEGWADCFTDDAVYESAFPGLPTRRQIRGRAELVAFAAQHHGPGEFFAHLLIAPVIAVDGDEATVVSHAGRMGSYGSSPVVDALGRYHDTLVRCPDGRWRFRHRLTDLTVLHPVLADQLMGSARSTTISGMEDG